MNKIPIEVLLDQFYNDLYREYQNDAVEYKRELFLRYMTEDVRRGLENREHYGYCSNPCRPDGWNWGIALYADAYVSFRFYFISPVDLRDYAQELVNDNHFKELVKVAFYIQENFRPRE